MPSPARTIPLALAIGLLLATPDSAHALEWSGVVLNNQNGVSGMQAPSDVLVSPDGSFAYVAGHGGNSIAIFARDAATGALSYLDNVGWDGNAPPGTIPNLRLPVALAISPDGLNLYAAGGTTNSLLGIYTSNVTCFTRDPQTGALTYLASILDNSGPGLFYLDTPLDVLVSSDGKNVYVTAVDAPALTVLTRDPQTGLLSALQVVNDDDASPGVGLEGIQTVAESPDGAYLYVASASHPSTIPGLGGVATFARAADGQLTFVNLQQQNLNGVDGLWAPRGVAASPDNRHVYVAAGGRPNDPVPQPGSLAIFARQLDGSLSFVDSMLETDIGLLSKSQPRQVAVSSDGGTVYMISYGRPTFYDGTLAVFTRDADTGLLTVDHIFQDNVAGVDGLGGALGIGVSPDDQDVYVASEQDPYAVAGRGAVAIFNPVPEPGAAAGGLFAIASLAALAQRNSASQSRGRRNSL